MQEEIIQAFADALCETLQMMSGLEVRKKVESDKQFNIIGQMLLKGEQEMIIVIATNRESAGKIVSYMTGTEIGDLSDRELIDGILELSNMTSGIVKGRLSKENSIFTLTSPISLVGNDIQLITKKDVKKDKVVLGSNEVEIEIELIYF